MLREIILVRRVADFGRLRQTRTTMPLNSTWYVMTDPWIKLQRRWRCRIGLNMVKPKQNELGWTDFRLTKYQDIEKWWEIVCSTYLLVSLFADSQINSEKSPVSGSRVRELLQEHPEWDEGTGWKNWRGIFD